eukprot:3191221-Pleurochrysis_carterae.AAC.1
MRRLPDGGGRNDANIGSQSDSQVGDEVGGEVGSRVGHLPDAGREGQGDAPIVPEIYVKVETHQPDRPLGHDGGKKRAFGITLRTVAALCMHVRPRDAAAVCARGAESSNPSNARASIAGIVVHSAAKLSSALARQLPSHLARIRHAER